MSRDPYDAEQHMIGVLEGIADGIANLNQTLAMIGEVLDAEPAAEPPTRESIAEAIRLCRYPLQGIYELSERAADAVLALFDPEPTHG